MELFEEFGSTLTQVKRDFLAKSLFEMLSECDRQGISVALFLESLGDAIRHERGHEWHECLMNLERASTYAHEAQRIDTLTQQVLRKVKQ